METLLLILLGSIPVCLILLSLGYVYWNWTTFLCYRCRRRFKVIGSNKTHDGNVAICVYCYRDVMGDNE